ncbi:hypothetical protein LQW54_006361 [Pestalotiopsis sp. IQ-011]
MEKARQYQCSKLRADGKTCGATFKKKWNLKRHLEGQHGTDMGLTFINSLARSEPDSPSLVLAGQPRRPDESTPTVQVKLPGIASLFAFADRNTTDPYSPGPDPRNGAAAWPPALLPAGKRQESDDSWAQKRWSLRARFQERAPAYYFKLSKKIPDQPKALQWLAKAGKDHFDSWIADLTTLWGISPTANESSPCIGCPQDWAHLLPEEIAESLNERNGPRVSLNRLVGLPWWHMRCR